MTASLRRRPFTNKGGTRKRGWPNRAASRSLGLVRDRAHHARRRTFANALANESRQLPVTNPEARRQQSVSNPSSSRHLSGTNPDQPFEGGRKGRKGSSKRGKPVPGGRGKNCQTTSTAGARRRTADGRLADDATAVVARSPRQACPRFEAVWLGSASSGRPGPRRRSARVCSVTPYAVVPDQHQPKQASGREIGSA